MSIEAIVGTVYCLIGVVHLVILAIRAYRHPDLVKLVDVPMGVFVVVFAWPLVDALWLVERRD